MLKYSHTMPETMSRWKSFIDLERTALTVVSLALQAQQLSGENFVTHTLPCTLTTLIAKLEVDTGKNPGSARFSRGG